MSEKLAAALTRAGLPFLRDEPLSRHTTLGIGGPVPALLAPVSAEQAALAIDVLGELGMPWRVLGAGSNLLADDDGLDFAVMATHALAREAEFAGTRLTADAGVFLPRLVRATAERGLAGLEWGIGVPGSVGGALFMNAGAWGADISQVVESVTVVSARDGRASSQPFAPRFAYRRAGVEPGAIVTQVVFRLRHDQPHAVLERVERYLGERRRTQPTAARSAGCAFKNPPGDSAGRLVDATGLKGHARGAAVVSPLHANFVLNRGGARAADFVALIEEVRARVLEQHGVRLEDEIVRWRGGQAP